MWRDISKEIPPFFSAFEMLHAFDLVGHDIKVDLLLSHGLLPVVVRLLHTWYQEQYLESCS